MKRLIFPDIERILKYLKNEEVNIMNKLEDMNFIDYDKEMDGIGELIRVNLHDFQVKDKSLPRYSYEKSIFTNIEFIGCNADRSDFYDIAFNNCNFSNSSFEEVSFVRCEFNNCKLTGASFVNGTFRNCNFKECNLNYANLTDTRNDTVKFENSGLVNTYFHNAFMKKMQFNDSNLAGIQFYNSSLSGIDLTSCNIDGIGVNIEDLKGLIVSEIQALEFIRFLGIKIV